MTLCLLVRNCGCVLAAKALVCSLEARLADLEKLTEAERYIDETFRDALEAAHSRADGSCNGEERS